MAGQTSMNAERAAGLLVVGFHGLEVPDALRAFVAEGAPAGVVLFARNVASVEQVAALTRELRGLWPAEGPAPIIAVDQEGGPVRRLKAPRCPEVLDLPSAREMAAQNDPDWTRGLGVVTGAQLAALGFDLDFAPVLDVDSNPANPVIGRRAFGATPAVVTRQALAFAAGLEEAGVLACGKHFPGHGDTDLDSHLALPSLAHDLDRLRSVELAPFDAAARAGLPAMMTAHIVFEALDAEWPATLSPRVLPQLLRQELGYDGVVFSDDLEMRAIAAHHDPATIARQGLRATVDLFLVCHRLDVAAGVRDGLVAAARSDGAALEAFEHAERRVASLRARLVDHAVRPFGGVLPGQAAGATLLERLSLG